MVDQAHVHEMWRREMKADPPCAPQSRGLVMDVRSHVLERES